MPVKKILSALRPGRAAADAAAAPTTKRINLALQGGGAHGAFTWGVLEYCSPTIAWLFEGVSGTSSGAVNAVMFADGLARGGRAEAQKRLTDFWRSVSSTGDLPPMQRAVVERLLSFTPLEGSPVQAWFDMMSRYFSPYDFNPLNINPLKDLIERFVDFKAVQSFSDLQLFVSATNVQTGRVRVFPREKVTADAVMASACLPELVSRRRNRRRSLLGWRLSGQSGDLSVLRHDRNRGRAGRADQSAGAANDADIRRRDHEPHQRNHLQLAR